jgi:hypothetical protein
MTRWQLTGLLSAVAVMFYLLGLATHRESVEVVPPCVCPPVAECIPIVRVDPCTCSCRCITDGITIAGDPNLHSSIMTKAARLMDKCLVDGSVDPRDVEEWQQDHNEYFYMYREDLKRRNVP